MTLLAAFQVLLQSLLGPGRFRRRDAGRRANSPRAGGPDWVFRQHARLRGDLSGDPGVPRAAPPDPPNGDRGIHPSGTPFREAGDRRRSRSRRESHAALPGDVRPPKRAVAGAASAELVLTPLELSSRTSKFDLTLFATEVPEGLRLTMEYSTDLFDAATSGPHARPLPDPSRRDHRPSRSADRCRYACSLRKSGRKCSWDGTPRRSTTSQWCSMGRRTTSWTPCYTTCLPRSS